MIRITQEDTGRIQKYFGGYGGMIMPEAMTPELYVTGDVAKQLLIGDDFNRIFNDLIAALPEPAIYSGKVEGIDVISVKSQARLYIIAGHLALASVRGICTAYMGSYDNSALVFGAEAAKKLNIVLNITMSREQAKDAELCRRLENEGAVLEKDNCTKLHNRPHMYAYQNYIGKVAANIGKKAEYAFIPDGAEMGGYPFPALSGIFAEAFGKKVKSMVPETSAVAATIKNGNGALGLFRAYRDENCLKVSVEPAVCQQYYIDAYGGASISVRTSAPAEHPTAIPGELADMWNMAKAARLGTEYYGKHEAGIFPAATMRAIHLIAERLPDIETAVIVEGENE